MTELDDSPKTILKRFYVLQEERIQTYHLFEEGFEAYIKGYPNYNFPMYRQLVHEITETFKKISQEILSMIETLNTKYKLKTITDLITNIQEEEKNKLHQTVQLQLAKQQVLDHPGSEEEHMEKVIQCKHSLAEIGEAIASDMEELKYEAEDILLDETEDQQNIER